MAEYRGRDVCLACVWRGGRGLSLTYALAGEGVESHLAECHFLCSRLCLPEGEREKGNQKRRLRREKALGKFIKAVKRRGGEG